MNKPFTLVTVTNEQVVLKVNAEDNLMIAMHPYISSDYDYITVTRGSNHILTIIYTNGHTFDFHWGIGGYTLISDGLERLRREVCDFIKENHILLDMKSDVIRKATVYYNNNYHKWQLTLNDSGHYWSDKARCQEDMFEEAKMFNVNASEWKHRIAITGIDVWDAILI